MAAGVREDAQCEAAPARAGVAGEARRGELHGHAGDGDARRVERESQTRAQLEAEVRHVARGVPHRARVARPARIALIAVGASVVFFAATAVFERLAPRRLVRAWQKRVGAPMFRFAVGYLPGWVLVETIGRRT